jgi:hypothetical protein
VQFALVHGNAAHILKVPRQDVQHSPGTVGPRQKVDVVKVSKHSLPVQELALGSIQGWLDGERKKARHQRIALLAAFTLLDQVSVPAVVRPNEPRPPPVPQTHVRNQVLKSWVPEQLFKKPRAQNVVEGTHTVDAGDSHTWARFRIRPEKVC